MGVLLANFGLLDRRSLGPAPMLLISAGQSNCEKGQLITTTDIAPPYDGPFPEVQYWKAGAGDEGFLTLDPTDQDSYQAPLNGVTLNYAHQFYLYPALAAALSRTALLPLYVVSNSIGDTSLAVDWIPGGSRYNDLVTRVNAAKAHLLNLYGVAANVIFCLFDQSEKDARVLADAGAYATNQQDFVDQLRIDVGEPSLKFLLPQLKLGTVVGSPNPCPFGASTNIHKATVAAGDPSNILVQDTNWCEPSTDGVHFTVAGQIQKCLGLGGTVGAARMCEMQVLIDAGWIPGTPSSAVPTDQTYFDGGHYTRFGDILDSLFVTAGVFRVGVTVWNPPPYTSRTLASKIATTGNQRCWHWLWDGDGIRFNYYRLGSTAMSRSVTYTGLSAVLYDGNEHDLEVRYNGAVSTNDGLDRVDLYVDGALYTTGKALVSIGTLGTGLFNSSAQLAVGAIVASGGLRDSEAFMAGGWLRNFFVQDGAGLDSLRCPNLATGTDTSGNGHNGTFTFG